MRYALILVVLLSSGCRERAGVGKSGSCDAPLARLASNELVAMTLLEGRAERLPVECGKVSCLKTRDDAVAVVQRDGAVWAAWEGQPGKVLSPELSGDETEIAVWALSQEEDPRQPPAPAGRGPPPLPRELRTCGTTRAGDGYGYHIIRNADDVWQRIHWVVPPVADDVKALDTHAYPLVDREQQLCAFALQDPPRHWTVHHRASGTAIQAARDHEHPPASCRVDGSVEVQVEDGRVIVAPDGQKTFTPGPPPTQGRTSSAPREAIVDIAEKHLVKRPVGPLRVMDADGETVSFPLTDDADLAGRKLPPHTIRQQLLTLGDGAQSLLVAERFLLPDCRGLEVLYLLRRDTREVKVIAEGDVVFARLGFAIDRFFWLEAQPKLIDLSAG